jgi:hypothetical protein
MMKNLPALLVLPAMLLATPVFAQQKAQNTTRYKSEVKSSVNSTSVPSRRSARVITEWSSPTGKDLKTSPTPPKK